jgi:periplasmic divalent cation tolerance protein
MSEHRITYITAPAEVAERIANTLVEEKLATCVNIVGSVISIYRWEGQVERATEALLLVKGTAEQTEPMISRVREIHPYEVPEILVTDIVAGNKDYLDWLAGKEIVVEDDLDLDEDVDSEDDEEEDEEQDGEEGENEEKKEETEA